MNSNPKSNLDFSKSQLEQYSDDTILEVIPEKIDDNSASKYVLIKHDYYSSDNDHGRELLSCFLSALSNSSYNGLIIYLTDKGTQLLDKTNPLHEQMLKLIGKSEIVIAASESIDYYAVDVIDNSKLVFQSAASISEDIVYLSALIILE